jgi:hypothetical protein
MHAIAISSVQLITSKYGSEKGQIHFDAEETITHDIFLDRIVLNTNFRDDRSYQASIEGDVLYVKKLLYHVRKKEFFEGTMDEDDWEELDVLWRRMEYELVTGPKFSEMDVRAELLHLFSLILTEKEAEIWSKKLPTKKKPDLKWVWKQITSALAQANRSVSFEWQEWAEIGIMEVNKLGAVQELSSSLPYPDEQQIEDVTHDADWDAAILRYFNGHLNASGLKLIAIGTHFDEYQMFACLPVRDLNLVNAFEILKKLGLVYKD